MPSPFPANAVLTFRLPSGGLVTDEATGNVFVGTTEVSLQAYLKPDSKPQSQNYPGVDETAERLTGRLVDPTALPDGIGKDTRGAITIGGRSGTCQLSWPTQSPFGVNEVLGDKIYVAVRWQA